jgi:hypothetical protein
MQEDYKRSYLISSHRILQFLGNASNSLPKKTVVVGIKPKVCKHNVVLPVSLPNFCWN